MINFSILRKAYERWQTWFPPLQGMPNPYSVLSLKERKDDEEIVKEWWQNCLKETLKNEKNS